MAKGFIAIDTHKNIHEFSEEGIKNLKRLHETQKVKGWQYGLKEQKNELLSKVITTEDAQSAIEENAKLKAELEALKAEKETVGKEPKKAK